jgi:hypothetical protein
LVSRIALADSGPAARLFITRAATPAERAQRDTHALYEPAIGCYLGAFVDFDPMLSSKLRDQNGTEHHDPAEFETLVGKRHAVYFFYLGYGRPFPVDWARKLAGEGKFVHVALEPNDGLQRVKDDVYLRKLATDMARSGARIFLRFASEMNGAWTIYSKHPDLYREKFALVHRVMHRFAPNVATVWCPYAFPRGVIDRYYPGDNACDWVGINMYSVTYHNNQRSEPADTEHPCDLLDSVYPRYSARKPVMICEFAATHLSAVDRDPHPDFAVRKMLQLFVALPRVYPRVKCINYFDGNNMAYAGDRACNDYSVTDDPWVQNAYRFCTAPAWYLSAPLATSNDPALNSLEIPMPLSNRDTIHGVVRLSCWARGKSDAISVRYKVDGIQIYLAKTADLWECLWNSGTVRPGMHSISLEVLGKNGRIVATESVRVRINS